VWQEKFERYRDKAFTVVGIALDAEGLEPARLYYEKFGVRFHALVDPNYATGFGAIPKTFFIDELGLVQPLENWEQRLRSANELAPVTEKIRRQWNDPDARLQPSTIARLVEVHAANPIELKTAVDLASRYLDLGLKREALSVLKPAVASRDPKRIAQSADSAGARLLGQAYFQLARAAGPRDDQVRFATLAFYLNPTVGYGKQIARIIAPERFDHRPAGDFDNDFREGTLRRLQRERQQWLQQTN
jgi:hypothetical protein